MEKNIVKINEKHIRGIVSEAVRKALNEYGINTYGSDGDEPYDVNDLHGEIINHLMVLLELQGEANFGEWSLDGSEEKDMEQTIEELKDDLVWCKDEAKKIGESIDVEYCFNDAVESCLRGYERKIKSAIPQIKKLLSEILTGTFKGYDVMDGIRAQRGH